MIGRLGGILFAPVRRLAGAWRVTRRTATRVDAVLDAVLVLPRLSEQLDVIGFQTATLVEMHADIARMRGDTAALRDMSATLERMAVLLDRVDANTAAVEQLAEVVLPLQGAAMRFGRAADRWPVRQRPPRP